MASTPASPRRKRGNERRSIGKGSRPQPLRTQSEAIGEEDEVDITTPLTHTRHKSTSTPTKLARLSASPSQRSQFSPTYSSGGESPLSPKRSIEQSRERAFSATEAERVDSLTAGYAQDIVHYDFTKIDYELERARKLGSGLWSNVFLSEPTLSTSDSLKLPSSPPKSAATSQAVLAIKTPARRDANVVFRHEARVLSHLQYFSGSTQFIVPFYGMDTRNDALVFEAVVGGSLEDLTNRLKHMTDFARHQEIVTLFPSIARDLICGLVFMHDAGVVHADIKPQNILIDISDHYSLPTPVIRARFIDFSAAFIPSVEDSMPAGGGTWDFMAPEQMRVQKDLSTPTFASDVWSLGITLLTLVVLGSPYRAACGDNVFMLREAIKTGDPLGFARMSPTVKTRMDACQDFIDCCRLALQKDRDRRTTASAWRRWLEEQNS